MATKPSTTLITLLFLTTKPVQSQLISLTTSNQLIDDGLHLFSPQKFNHLVTSRSTCKHAYGFIPCADNVGGYVFQIILFQYLLFIGSKLVRNGSKKLFTMIGTGVFGASIFGVLLGLPEIIFVVISGVYSTKGEAKRMVSIGVAVYAGSIVLSLTLVWGMCVIVGGEDLDIYNNNTRTYNSLDNPSSSNQCLLIVKEKFLQFKGRGVHTDNKTRDTAIIMLLSLVPYGILQTIDIFNTSSSGSHQIVLVALVVSTSLLLAYFIYQIRDPWIQERSLQYSKHETLVKYFLKYAIKHAQGDLIDENGQPNVLAIERLFREVDKNADDCISVEELELLVHELKPENDGVDEKYAEEQMIEAFHISRHGRISLTEFVQGIMNLLHNAKDTAENSDTVVRKFLRKVIKPFTQRRITTTTTNVESSWEEVDSKIFEIKHDGTLQQRLLVAWAYTKPLSEILSGVLVITFIGDPFMDSIVDLSDSMGISTFFISFIIVPIIMNAKKATTAIVSASKKNKRTTSLTFSEIYGEVVMNNVMGLTTLLAIVWANHLDWEYSAEVLIIFLTCAIVGSIAYWCNTYPLWTSILACFMYLFSIVLYYILNFFLGW